MAKQIHIRISEPCHENWNAMTANQQGAFCKSCKKNVIDFTAKTENEIYETVMRSEENLCGRFMSFQLEQPIRKTELKNGWLNWRAIAASVFAFFSFNKVFSATDTATKPTVVVVEKTEAADTAIITPPIHEAPMLGKIAVQTIKKNLPEPLNGKVIEAETKEAIAFANVHLKKSGNGVSTDMNGKFVLNTDGGKVDKNDTLVVQCVGYKTKEFPLQQFKSNSPLELKMEVRAMMGFFAVVKEPLPVKNKERKTPWDTMRK